MGAWYLWKGLNCDPSNSSRQGKERWRKEVEFEKTLLHKSFALSTLLKVIYQYRFLMFSRKTAIYNKQFILSALLRTLKGLQKPRTRDQVKDLNNLEARHHALVLKQGVKMHKGKLNCGRRT